MEYALITGASSGIGMALARLMASKGHHLILVARRADVLEKLKAELAALYAVNIEVMPMDLSQTGQPEKLYQQCKTQNLQVQYLINNAGFGDYKKFDQTLMQSYINMLQLNVIALTELTGLFLQDMKQRATGHIMNVGSIAAFQPGPNMAVYAASKAYVMSFTEALNYELRGSGVKVTLLSPGVTETGFISRAGMATAANAKNGLMNAFEVAAAGYKAMMAGKLNVTPGWKNQLLTLGSRTMPSREVLLRIAGSILKDTGVSN